MGLLAESLRPPCFSTRCISPGPATSTKGDLQPHSTRLPHSEFIDQASLSIFDHENDILTFIFILVFLKLFRTWDGKMGTNHLETYALYNPISPHFHCIIKCTYTSTVPVSFMPCHLNMNKQHEFAPFLSNDY